MRDPGLNAAVLEGKQVAVTGRLASMTRAGAAALIQAHGGIFVATVSRRTSLLIVGQDGWPLEQDGSLNTSLRKARSLQRAGHEITILPEEELLARIGLEQHSEAVRQLYDMAQLSRLVKVPGTRLRKWVNEGLIRPVQTINGISLFDYAQVVSARTLWDLIQRGVKPARLRRSIGQLKSWLANVDQPLLQLAVLEGNCELLVRLEDGLAEPTGQRCFDFDDTVDEPTVSMSQGPATADEWFQQACDHEDAGQFDEAVQAYRQSLLLDGPNPAVCFNLGNALVHLELKAEALERFYQVVELDRNFAEAWSNLGVVLTDLGRIEEAKSAFAQALAVNPGCANAHYNLADLLDETGQGPDALAHWQAYLSQDRQSQWAKHARDRLAEFGT